MKWMTIAAVCVVFVMPGVGQTGAGNAGSSSEAKTPSYEIVSIRPNKSDALMNEDEPADGFIAKAITLHQLVAIAYAGTPFSLIDTQIEGEPSWLRSEKFDVTAKVDDSEIAALKKVEDGDGIAAFVQALAQGVPTVRMRMLQELLADRFKLKVHYVTKELPVYNVVMAKGGAKVKKSSETDSKKGDLGFSDGKIKGKSIPLSLLPVMFCFVREVGRPVIDRTGLEGLYDLELKWTPEGHVGELPADAPPGLFTAIQEQMGLELEAAKGPVKVLVIDHVERPSAN